MRGHQLTSTPRRAGGYLPDVVLATGWVAQAANAVVVVVGGAWGDLLWIGSTLVGLGAATLVRRRRPDHVLSSWFAALESGTAWVQFLDTLLLPLAMAGAGPWGIASTDLVSNHWSMVTQVAAIHLFTVFPDGAVRHERESSLLRAAWLLLAAPIALALVTPVVAVPWYIDIPPVDNPFHLPWPGRPTTTPGALWDMLDAAVVVAWVMLALRYRGLEARRRQQVRWLLVPVVVAIVGLALNVFVASSAPMLVNLVAVGLPGMTGAAVAMALLAPAGIDVDRVLRRSVVYGVLWVAIAGAYAGAAAAVGLAAGRRVSVGAAVLMTVVATLLFQPARARLETLADRWVFGHRADPTRVIARLGETLATTYDLQALLPRMADTVRDGLGLAWARVRLHDDRDVPSESADHQPAEPVLTVPITLDGEHLGVVECGPRMGEDLHAHDRAVVETLARQAAMAVRNVRLTSELADQAARLAASRTRLVRAQESERRRIERNIHDGVQQELVALIAQAGNARGVLARDSLSAADELARLQAGLRRVLDDLRQLAAGIHPSLLSDRGLLAAVESLAARNPVPVIVRADPDLRSLRTSPEVEGAGYFTVAEALANSLKHASASNIDITLQRTEDQLVIAVRDDGCGLEHIASGSNGVATNGGNGLANLGERVSALGGRFTVTGAPGAGTTVTAALPLGEGL